jgi:hypothetical protein
MFHGDTFHGDTLSPANTSGNFARRGNARLTFTPS